MESFVKKEAQASLNAIDACLQAYADGRDPQHRVGQFLDREGRNSAQAGVYGMSAWLLLTRHLQSHASIAALRQACARELAAAALGTSAESKFNADLARIVPKMAYGFAALATLAGAMHESNVLLQRILAAQNKQDGGWAFSIELAEPSNVMCTAITVRLMLGSPAAADAVKKATQFLRAALETVSDPLVRLFVLSTLAKASAAPKISEVAGAVKELYRKVSEHPTRYSNPTLVDYQDGARTRYIRIPSDVILLEALSYLCGPWMLYLQAHSGRRTFRYVTSHTKSIQAFDIDANGNRASVGAYLYLQQTLMTIRDRCTAQPWAWSARVSGWFAASARFGFDFTWNLIALFFSAVATLVFHWLNWDPIRNVTAGVAAKSLMDGMRSVYMLARRSDER